MDNAKGRAWCFTQFNYDDDLVARYCSLPCERLVIGREVCPSTGNLHLQGYVRFKEPVRFSWWKNQFPTARVDRRKGTELEAANYCLKDGDVVVDKGVNFDEKLEKGLSKNEEASQVIAEAQKGASYGQIRQRHLLFTFWNRRAVMDFVRDEKWFTENPGVDPTC